MEAAYCKVLVRPFTNATGATGVAHYCLEMPERHLNKFNNMVGACFHNMNDDFFDPFNATQVAALPQNATFSWACRDKFNEWIDPTDGWGCCVPALLDGFRINSDF